MFKVREEAFRYYFYFVQERMKMFWKRYEGETFPFTSDATLSKHKFTNVYRACDRVSQYLIKEVIYGKNEKLKEDDILLRILVFKIFNRIDTWKFLESTHGLIKISNFNVNQICQSLNSRIKQRPIFNSAYMMTGTHKDYEDFRYKHEKWLNMVDREMIRQGRLMRISNSKSLEEVFRILNECSFLGPFLSYQYAIDFNYSPVIDFDENSFVKAGIGSIRGIKKCFEDLGNKSFEDAIRFTQDNFEKYQKMFGFMDFKPLFNRNLTLIDLQNCFCETDKYLRVKLPHLMVDNVRIKQKFTSPQGKIAFYFPPKWNINQFLKPW
jgi:hypothetical protein